MEAGGHWGLSGLQGQLGWGWGQRSLACREGFRGIGSRGLRSRYLKPLRAPQSLGYSLFQATVPLKPATLGSHA